MLLSRFISIRLSSLLRYASDRNPQRKKIILNSNLNCHFVFNDRMRVWDGEKEKSFSSASFLPACTQLAKKEENLICNVQQFSHNSILFSISTARKKLWVVTVCRMCVRESECFLSFFFLNVTQTYSFALWEREYILYIYMYVMIDT
jgi:hypothetical protein